MIRVYNLSEGTANQIQEEFQFVSLAAGYKDGPYGTIFQGNIRMIRIGRENALNSFVDISAADADIAHAFGVVNTTLAAGSSDLDIVNACMQAMNAMDPNKVTAGVLQGVTQGAQTSAAAVTASQGIGGLLTLRGRVLYGLATQRLDDVAARNNASWFIEDGKLYFVKNTGYLDDIPPIELSPATGLIGVPTGTPNGLEVTSLLNPNMRPGRSVQINRRDIDTTFIKNQQFPGTQSLAQTASVTKNGLYRMLVVDHQGGNRETEFYTKLICLALDRGAPVNQAVVTTSTIQPNNSYRKD